MTMAYPTKAPPQNVMMMAYPTKAPPQHIYIPKISSPFSWKVHPLYENMRASYGEWILNVMSPSTNEEQLHLRGQKLPLLSCMLYPRAVHNRIHSITKAILWFTMLDDAVDDVQELGASFEKASILVKEYLHIIRSGCIGDLPATGIPATHLRLLQIFASIWKAFECDMSPNQFSTLKNHTQSMLTLQAGLTKSRQDNLKAATAPEEFIARKRVSGMHLFGLHLIEYALDVELEPEVEKDPELLELYRLTADCMLLCNELLSFRMEFLSNDFDNILWIICESENIGLDEAALRVKFMWDTNILKLSQLRQSLAKRFPDSHGLEKLLKGAGDILAGYVEWCWQTGRYHGHAWSPPLQREGVMFLEDIKSSHAAKFMTISAGSINY